MVDLAVIGAGPAGYSAAIHARKREKGVTLVGNHTGWLVKAQHLSNYPGLPDISGAQLLERMRAQAEALGARLLPGIVRSVVPMDGCFALMLGADFVQARRLILCTGARQPKLLGGEQELLGRGVSYCGTCDGALYRGRHVAVIAEAPQAVSEANFLSGICARVTYFGAPDPALDARVAVEEGRVQAVTGTEKATGLIVDGQARAFDGVFIFREAMALRTLLPGLETQGAFIRVDRHMRSSMRGVYAAGDCTGAPFQVAKAVGEGCVAALTACEEAG